MKQTENSFEFFVYFVLPIIFLALGLFVNILGMLLLTTSKRLAQVGPVNTYCYLLLVDCIFLATIIVNNYFLNGFSIGFSLLNDFTCQIYRYTLHVTGTLSKFCLVYILVERYLAIKFPVESNCFRAKTFQLVYHIAITAINCIYFMPVLFYFSIQHQTLTSSNSTVKFC